MTGIAVDFLGLVAAISSSSSSSIRVCLVNCDRVCGLGVLDVATEFFWRFLPSSLKVEDPHTGTQMSG